MSDPTPSPLQVAADLLIEAKIQIERITPSVTVMPTEPVKPGYQTSEFWLTVIQQGVALTAASGAIPGFTDPTLKATTLGAALVSLVLYVWSRYKAKA